MSPGRLPDIDDSHAIYEDVQFDFAGAEELAAEFRSTARVLDEQSDVRPGLAHGAREQWQGAYGDQFDQRVNVCVGDGRALAQALRTAAEGLDALADAARREQARRQAAREWEQEQKNQNVFEKGVDLVDDFIFGEDQRPRFPPEEPLVFRAQSQVAGQR